MLQKLTGLAALIYTKYAFKIKKGAPPHKGHLYLTTSILKN